MISTQLTGDDIHRMTSSVFLDGGLRGRSSTKFWGLLSLSAIIATAGFVLGLIARGVPAAVAASTVLFAFASVFVA